MDYNILDTWSLPDREISPPEEQAYWREDDEDAAYERYQAEQRE